MALKSITLINPGQEVYAAHASPPLWMAYLQAVLKEKGVKVRVIDEAAGQEIGKIGTEWTGFTVTTPTANRVYELSDNLRKKGIKVVLGGPHVTIFPDEALKHCDKVMIGEGEKTILQVFTGKKKKLSSELIKDIDSIPFPDWAGLPLEKYHSPTRKHNYLSIMTSRGCPFTCIFCYKGIFGRAYRMRSAENVLEELSMLKAKYGLKEIAFIDDNFTANKKRTKDILQGMIDRNLNLKWTAPNGIRVDSVDDELMGLMKKSGCYQLSFGIESGNQEVLDKIGKRIKLEQVKEAIALAKKHGIETIGFFMIALPFDTEETMQQTIDLAKELKLGYTQFTITTPYPGTPLYDLVEAEGKFLVSDWSKFGSYSGKAYYEYGELNSELVERMYKKAFKAIYFSPGYVIRKFLKNPLIVLAGFRYMLNIFLPKK